MLLYGKNKVFLSGMHCQGCKVFLPQGWHCHGDTKHSH